MSVYLVDESDMKSVADTIRAKTGSNEELAFPEGFNEAVDEIYESGKSDGVQSEYDRFWDNFQRVSTESLMPYFFSGPGWHEKTFRPKYDIAPKGSAVGLFYNNATEASLPKILDECGIKLDLSKVTNANSIFQNAQFSELGTIDLSSATSMTTSFSVYKCKKIEKIILPSTPVDMSTTFYSTAYLTSIRFEGKFMHNIDIKKAPLDVASMVDIIEHLENFNGTSNYQKYTLKFSDACWATLDALGPVSPNGNLWSEYVLDLGWLT